MAKMFTTESVYEDASAIVTMAALQSLARAVIIYSAIERMAARPATLSHRPVVIDTDDITQAQVEILTLLFTPSVTKDGVELIVLGRKFAIAWTRCCARAVRVEVLEDK